MQRYGITLHDFDSLFKKQSGQCPICKEELILEARGRERVCVDHNHKTGLVRGLLHDRCNVAIGLLKDDPTAFIMRKII